jgi:Recombination endonuclease VII
LTHKLNRYGLTQERFDQLLEAQGHACAMWHVQFEDGQLIFIDHDHACCSGEKRSCGACVRGLLCLKCNTALGYIEGMQELARAYMEHPLARPAVVPAAGPEGPRASGKLSCAGAVGAAWERATLTR